MKKQVILTALAMTVGALCAQAAPKKVAAEEVFATLAQTVPNQAGEMQQRQAALAALAYIPADTDGYIAFAHLGKHLRQFLSGGMWLDQPVGPVPDELNALQSLAVSLGDGSAEGMQLLLSLIAVAQEEEERNFIPMCWEDDARKELKHLVRQAVSRTFSQSMEADKDAALNKWQMKPLYAVLTLSDGQEKQVEQWSKMLVSMVLASYVEQAEPLEHDGFLGVKIKEAEVAPNTRKDLYLMVKNCGSTLVVALCANPQDVKLPTSVEQSALVSPQLAACDANLQELLFVGYAGKEVVQAADAAHRKPVSVASAAMRRIFDVLGIVYRDQKAEYTKASAGVDALQKQLLGLFGPVPNQDALFLCRLNKQELTLESSYDAAGASYEPGVLRYVAQSNDRNNIFYAESTPFRSDVTAPTLGQFLPPLLDAWKGYALTLSEDKKKEADQTIGFIEKLTPEWNLLDQAFATIGKGLGRGGAFLLDADGSLPSLFGGAPDNTIAMPRLAYSAPVTQRACLAQGWDEILKAAAGVAGKCFGSSLLVKALSFPSKQTGDAVSYCFYMPVCTEHMVPNVTVSDTNFIIGSSSAYNEKLVSAATGTMPYQGSVFSLHFEPLATTLRGIADSYRSRIPAEEEAVPMSDVEEVADMIVAAKAVQMTDLEKLSEKLEEWAVNAELAAGIAKSLYGSVTIDQGRYTLRTVVKLQKR